MLPVIRVACAGINLCLVCVCVGVSVRPSGAGSYGAGEGVVFDVASCTAGVRVCV